MSIRELNSSDEKVNPLRDAVFRNLTAVNFTATGNQVVDGDLEVKGDLKVDTDFQVVGHSVQADISATSINFGQSNLNNYEFLAVPSGMASGPMTTPQSAPYSIVRVGQLVTINIPGIGSSAASNAVSMRILPDIPARFLPQLVAGAITTPILVTNNSSPTLGMFNASYNGILSMGNGTSSPSTAFTGAGTVGFFGCSVSYVCSP
jgi:hypothetical protein